MQATSAGYLPDLCTIQRATQTQDDLGGVVLTWAIFATDVRCRMDEPKTGTAEQAIDMAPGTAVKRIMHFGYSQDVTVKDRVVYGGLTYEVSEVQESASWLISRRVIVSRIE